MRMKGRLPGQSVLDGRYFVGAVVVHHQVKILCCEHVGFDGGQELQELATAAKTTQIPVDRSSGDIQRGEQRGRAVAIVFMGAPRPDARGQRQKWLRAVQRSDLALLRRSKQYGFQRRA